MDGGTAEGLTPNADLRDAQRGPAGSGLRVRYVHVVFDDTDKCRHPSLSIQRIIQRVTAACDLERRRA